MVSLLYYKLAYNNDKDKKVDDLIVTEVER
jgi:hypothetical protein